jgi:thymidylate synthase
MKTKELVGSTVEVAMRYPVVSCPERKLGYNFMAAEACWILSGSDRLDFHPEIRKKLEPYSDDGYSTNGAYGPPFLKQLSYCANALSKDPDSRQAVMTIWERTPKPSKDIPCTVALQFMIRHDILHTNVFMRSSDVWMGLPYDIFSFTMMSMVVAIEAGVKDLGRLTMFLGSSHLYERNWADAQEMIHKWDWASTAPWQAKAFKTTEDLMAHLKSIADSDDAKTGLCRGAI